MRRQQPVTCRRRRRCSRKFAKGRRRAISREKQRPTVPTRGSGGGCRQNSAVAQRNIARLRVALACSAKQSPPIRVRMRLAAPGLVGLPKQRWRSSEFLRRRVCISATSRLHFCNYAGVCESTVQLPAIAYFMYYYGKYKNDWDSMSLLYKGLTTRLIFCFSYFDTDNFNNYYSRSNEVKGPDYLDSSWGNPERVLNCWWDRQLKFVILYSVKPLKIWTHSYFYFYFFKFPKNQCLVLPHDSVILTTNIFSV